MRIKCEKCGQSYEIDSSRIKGKVVRIKCPSCNSAYLLRSDGHVSPIADNTQNDDATAPDNALAAPVGDAEETLWKARYVGLTYTFHDLGGLRDWLSGRTSLEDVKIAKGEDDWRELGDYKEVLTTEMIAKFFPLGDVPTSSAPRNSMQIEAVASENRPAGAKDIQAMPLAATRNLGVPDDSATFRKSRKEQQNRKKNADLQQKKFRKAIIYAVVFVGIVLALLIGWRYYSGMHAADYAAGGSSGAEPQLAAPVKPAAPQAANKAAAAQGQTPTEAQKPGDGSEKTDDTIDADDIDVLAELDLQKQISDAEELVGKKMYPEARATLESLRKEIPDNPDILRLLSATYKGLGLDGKAAEAEAQIAKLKQNQAD